MDADAFKDGREQGWRDKEARINQLLEALGKIARQKLREELTMEEHGQADFEGAYDMMIQCARRAT